MATPEQLKELARQIAQGDVRAFNRLYKALHDEVRTHLGRRGLPNMELEEIINWTFFQAWLKMSKRFIEYPRAYILRIARNIAVNHYRERRAHQHKLERLESFMQINNLAFLDAIATHDDINNLVQNLGKLRHFDRRVVIMRFFEGKTASEVAAKLGVSVGVVNFHAHQGKRQLRQLQAAQEP